MSVAEKQFDHYIEHEVQLRLHKEKFLMNEKRNDEKFSFIDKRFDGLDNKLNFIIGIVLGSVIIPVGLHWLKLI